MLVSLRRFIKKRKRQGTVYICLLFAFMWLISIVAIIIPSVAPWDNLDADFLPERRQFLQSSKNASNLDSVVDKQNLTLPSLFRPASLGRINGQQLKPFRNPARNNRWKRLLLTNKKKAKRIIRSDDDGGSGLVPDLSSFPRNSLVPQTRSSTAISETTRRHNKKKKWTSEGIDGGNITVPSIMEVEGTSTTTTTTTTTVTENGAESIIDETTGANFTVSDSTISVADTITTTALPTSTAIDPCNLVPLGVQFPEKFLRHDGLRVRWDLPKILLSYNVTIIVNLYEKLYKKSFDSRTRVLHNHAKTANFNGLKSCTEYLAHVCIVLNECGRNINSNIQCISSTTKTPMPKKMNLDVAVECSTTTANVSWSNLTEQCAEVSNTLDINLSNSKNEIVFVNSSDTFYQFEKLSPYTAYVFEIKDSLNRTWQRNCTTLPVVPDKLSNLTLQCNKYNVAFLSWSPSNRITGKLETYVLQYNISKNEDVCHNGDAMPSNQILTRKTTFNKTLLCAESLYTFTVRAKNSDVDELGEGWDVSCRTLAKEPPKCNKTVSAELDPSNRKTQIKVYFNNTIFSNENGRITHFWIIVADSKCKGKDLSEPFIIGSLSAGTNFSIKIRAFNSVGFTDSVLLYIMTDSDESEESLSLVVSILALILVITCTALLLFVLKRKKDVLKTIQSIRKMKCGSSAMHMTTIPVKVTSKPVPVADFEDHYQIMASDSSLKFSMEFEELAAASPTCPITAAKMTENRPKNRWVNILPFDHSRVKLLPIADDVSTDYINASYIPGYTSKREYIASQGPLPSTKDDFWRMVWEQNSQMIVMVTQCIERGKVKCEQYWPSDNEVHHYGDLGVRLKSESILNGYTLRIFEVQLSLPISTQISSSTSVDVSDCLELIPCNPEIDKGCRTLEVKQMHFTTWPDFGCPENTSLLLNFISSVRDHMSREPSGPVIVHCSAGVGRTGTFITVDKIMQHVNDHDFVDIYGTVREMRYYRTNMVQTEDQYVYIHECVKDYLIERRTCGQSVYGETGELLTSCEFSEIAQIHVASNARNSYLNVDGRSDDAISEIAETACLLSSSTTHTETSDRTDTFRSQMTDTTSCISDNSDFINADVFEILLSESTDRTEQTELLNFELLADNLNSALTDSSSLRPLSSGSQTDLTTSSPLCPALKTDEIACQNMNVLPNSADETSDAWEILDIGYF